MRRRSRVRFSSRRCWLPAAVTRPRSPNGARQTYVEPPSAVRDTYQKLLDAEQEGLQLCQDHNLRAEPPVQARIAELQREMTRLKAPIEHELYATRPQA